LPSRSIFFAWALTGIPPGSADVPLTVGGEHDAVGALHRDDDGHEWNRL
jgi:hypothetical protein